MALRDIQSASARVVRDDSDEGALEKRSAGAEATQLARLRSDDPYEVLDAARELEGGMVTSAIPALSALDIRGRAVSAPSVIRALGELASRAGLADRSTATIRLVELLAQEKARGAPESAGNVLQIYEALGKTSDSAAVEPLEAELLDANVTLAAKVVVVDSLHRLANPNSASALIAARAGVAAAVPEDAYQEEIRRELLAALERALERAQ